MNLGDMTVGADPEALFLCPYDKSHVIRKKIMPYHLMKCRRNWGGKEFMTCPFNSNHEIPAPEFNGHKQTCEDRYIIERDLELEMKKRKGKIVAFVICLSVLVSNFINVRIGGERQLIAHEEFKKN